MWVTLCLALLPADQAQDIIHMFLTRTPKHPAPDTRHLAPNPRPLTPKRPGRGYEPNDAVGKDYFRSVDDMDKICMDEGDALFPAPSQRAWEFLAFTCGPEPGEGDMQAKFPQYHGVPLVHPLAPQAFIVDELRHYFRNDGCPDCWDGLKNVMKADLVPTSTIQGYQGTPDSNVVVARLSPGRSALHTTDRTAAILLARLRQPWQVPALRTRGSLAAAVPPALLLLLSASILWHLSGGYQSAPSAMQSCLDCRLESSNLPQDKVTCSGWTSSDGEGFVEDVGTLTGTGAPGHRSASVGCGSDFVHVMCMQVIGLTPRPTPVELPLYVFKTCISLFDSGSSLLLDTRGVPGAVAPPSGLQGPDLADWICNNDPCATPNLVASNAGTQAHGPYLALVCTDPAITKFPAVDKFRFLNSGSKRQITRFQPDPARRFLVADDYSHFFNAQAGLRKDGQPGDCSVQDQLYAPPVDATFLGMDPSVATGCNEHGLFDVDGGGDCNAFCGGSFTDGKKDPYQIRHWDGEITCDQGITPTQVDVPRAVIKGDPHFVSFSGGAYDVHGAVLPHIRCRSTATRKPAGSLPLPAVFQAFFDNKALGFNRRVPLSKDASSPYSVMMVKKTHKQPPRLELQVPGYVLKFTYKHAPRRQYGRNMDESNNYRPHYFDFSVLQTFEKGHAFHPHGLLGQTARLHQAVKPLKNKRNGEGVIEATVDDYRVTDIFSSDFKFNEFDPTFHWKL
eukprot:gene271-2390_t